MKFTHPYILFFLWGIAPVAGILIYGARRREKILQDFAGEEMLEELVPGRSRFRVWGKMGLILLALILAVLSLADPEMGFYWEKVHQRGVDIMIALDCSRSMLAEDVSPNRLERAKREILDLVSLMKSDRAGLVAFAGNAFLQCPLTLDYQGFDIFLRVLSPEYLPVGGTNIKAAIETCYSGFDPASDTDKAIILITDGENTSEDLTEVASQMAEKGIRIFAVGVGDLSGAPVPDPSGGFIKDANGSIVMSRVDEAGLKQICALTSGHYVRSVAGDMDLDEIYTRRIAVDMNQKEFEQGRRKIGKSRFQWFLFPCVLLLLIEWVLPRTRPEKNKGVLKKSVLVLILTIWMIPGEAATENLVAKGIQAFKENRFAQARNHFIQAQLKNPEDLRLYYNIGTAAYKNQEYDLALDNFAKAAEGSDAELRHNSLYNMANTLIKKKELEKAIQTLENLLESFPEDEQAKDNLEWVKKKLEEEKQQQENRKNSSENQDAEKNSSREKEKSGENGQKNNDSSPNQQDQQDQSNDQNSRNRPEEKDSQKESSNPKEELDQQSPENPDSSGQEGEPQKQADSRSKKEDAQQENQQNSQARADRNEQSDAQENSGNAAGGTPVLPGQNRLPADARLNRLEDRPGAALIPQIRGQKVERDW